MYGGICGRVDSAVDGLDELIGQLTVVQEVVRFSPPSAKLLEEECCAVVNKKRARKMFTHFGWHAHVHMSHDVTFVITR